MTFLLCETIDISEWLQQMQATGARYFKVRILLENNEVVIG
ncbi:hypothetical protein [Sulfitobacter sp. EhC04]|nr:hypothetical protein [Sulfitobacter sp. EhC04]